MIESEKERITIMAAFRQLDREYAANTEDSPAVEALNTLPADERAMAIMHIANNGNVTKTAAVLGCDSHTMRKYLLRVRVSIEDKMKVINDKRGGEEWLN